MSTAEQVLHLADRLDGRAAGRRHCTDLGNSERLLDRHRDALRYCHPWQTWLWYDSARWRRDEEGAACRIAKETVRSIYEEAAAEDDDDRRKELAAWAKRSESKERISAMLVLAQSEVPIQPGDLDADPWLLNVDNGTLDLRTGRLRQHDREDYLTKIAPVEYDPSAPAPLWDGFLSRIMAGQPDLIGFLQRASGYGCTGSVREECLFFLHGAGANGKSKFIGGMHSALGDYASTAAPELLMMKRGDPNHPTELADLFGKRFVSTIEAEDGRRFAESLLKQLTGGDKIKGRGMRQDFFEFPPTHKFFLAANHKPTIKGTDKGIWRRVHLIPFSVSIPEAEQDKQLGEKLHAERAGILRWMVEGCLAWQRDGLQPPAEVRAATAEYRAEMDVLGDFLEECCTVADGAKVAAKLLYKAYTDWCEAAGERAESQKALAPRLTERGFRSARTKTGYVWHGLELTTPTPGDGEEVNHAAPVNDGEPNSGISKDDSLMRDSCGNSVHQGSPFTSEAPPTAESARRPPVPHVGDVVLAEPPADGSWAAVPDHAPPLGEAEYDLRGDVWWWRWSAGAEVLS